LAKHWVGWADVSGAWLAPERGSLLIRGAKALMQSISWASVTMAL
jgi:hypothetical protein